MVTGFEEILEVLKNSEDFSAIIGLQGAAAPLPFEPQGSDISAEVEAHRPQFLGGDLLVNYDDRHHTFVRSLLAPLFTPSRLKANEQFMSAYSDQLVRDAVSRGGCELIKEIATPFVTLVIAELLGVPTDDRQLFMDAIAAAPPPGSLQRDENDYSAETHPLVMMGSYFAQYVLDRQANPRGDVLSELANAKFPDGSTPDVGEIVRLGTFLFAAGQDTSAKLLGNSMRYIVDQPGLQDQLRKEPSLIPQLLEEVLRLEGSTKQTARLARRDTRIGDLKDSGWNQSHAGIGCRQSRSAALGGSAGLRPRPAENQGAHRFWARQAHLRRRTTGSGGGAGHPRKILGAYGEHRRG